MIFAVIAASILFLAILVCLLTFIFFGKAAGRDDRYADLYDDRAVGKFHFGDKITEMRAGADFVKASVTEEVYIKSFDGLRLYGRIIPAQNAKGTIILFHGYHSYIEFDYSCVVKKYHDMGYNLLLTSQRSHGKSEGKYIGFGILERFDCASWAEYAKERFGKDLPIILEGLSMGASTVLMASALPLPENVRAIIADCGFTSPDEIMVHVVRQMHLPYFPVVPLLRIYFRHFVHFDTKACSTVDALKKTTLPVLLIHGDADTFVPYSMSVRNDASCASPHELVTVTGAHHGQSYLVDHEKCDLALNAFLQKYAH